MSVKIKENVIIQIVAYNAVEKLESCLKSLEWAKGYATNILDNSDNPKIQNLITEKFPHIKQFQSVGNIGFGAAHNFLYQQANRLDPKYILLINPDLEITEHTFETLYTTMEINPETAILSCKLIDAHENQEANVFTEPTFLKLLLKFTLQLIGIRDYSPLHKRLDKTTSVFGVSGALMLIRTSVLEDKIFTEDYFMYMEDTDLCLRLRNKGFNIIYNNDVSAMHVRGASVTTHSESSNWLKLQFFLSTITYFRLNRHKYEYNLIRLMIKAVLWIRILIGIDRDWSRDTLNKI